MGNNDRDTRRNDATFILNTLKQGFYKIGNTNMVIPSFKPSEYLSEPKVRQILVSEKPKSIDEQNIEVYAGSTVDAVIKAKKDLDKLDRDTDTIGVLNFASAFHPGGGFLNGAMAQEEALCHASTLYPQLKNGKMYKYNEAMCSSSLYNHSMELSRTFFIRNGRGSFVTPVETLVVTAAAVNNRRLKRYEETSVEYTMKTRMEYILKVMIANKCKVVILGAFGCGVFGNDCEFVAKTWKELLEKYGGHFDTVVFAVTNDKSGNLGIFKDIFGG